MSHATPHPAPGVPASTWPRFDVSTYRPDGGADLPGVVMLISALALVGAVLGFIAHFIAQFFYLIILFPILIGFGVGFVGAMMVKKGRVRNPWIGGLAGLVGGVLAMLAMHYFDYESVKTALDAQHPGGAELGFIEFMNIQAEHGVEIGRTSSSINLGYIGSWIYWIVETLIVAGVTFFVVRSAAAEPYCPDCGVWKDERVLGGFGADPDAAAAALQSGDLERIRQANPSPVASPLVVTAAHCHHCAKGHRVDLKLESMLANKKGEVENKTLAHVSYPGEAMPYLAALFAAPEPAETATA